MSTNEQLTPQEVELIQKIARVTNYNQKATAELVYTYSFMGNYARTQNAVPSVRAIAQGRGQSIAVTREQIAKLAEAGLILNTVKGLCAPRDSK